MFELLEVRIGRIMKSARVGIALLDKLKDGLYY